MPKLYYVLILVLSVNLVISAQDDITLYGKAASYTFAPTDAVLYSQMSGSGTNALTSQNFETASDNYDNQGADDFIVPAGETWNITSVDVPGAYWNGSGPAASVNIWFYTNNSGLPGSEVASRLSVVPSSDSSGSLVVPFSTPVVLSAGTYWISAQVNMDFSPGGQWGWLEHTQVGSPSVWQNPGGGFATSCSSWGPRVATCAVGDAPYFDFAFRLNGTLGAVPVELTSFAAIVSNDNVTLKWSTATETNNRGFEVERSLNGSDYATVGFVNGNGTTTLINNYSFVNKNVNVGFYTYRLKQFDFDGTYEYSKSINVEVTAPAEYNLAQNFPNPFNPSTKISFGLAVDSKVQLNVFNLLGEKVAALVNSDLSAGQHNVNFDASNLTSGIYFYRLEAAGIDGQIFTATKKMLLTK